MCDRRPARLQILPPLMERWSLNPSSTPDPLSLVDQNNVAGGMFTDLWVKVSRSLAETVFSDSPSIYCSMMIPTLTL